MIGKLTIGKLLQEAGDLKFHKLPFHRYLIVALPQEVSVDLNQSATEVYNELKENGYTNYLNLVVDDLLTDRDNRITKCLVQWAFITGLVGSFAALLVVIYISVITKTLPDTWLTFILVIIPAAIMWNQAGVLKSENAASLANIIKSSTPNKVKKLFGQDDGEYRDSGYQQRRTYESDDYQQRTPPDDFDTPRPSKY